MDPATIVQIVGTAVSLGDVVLKCIMSLRSLKSKYKDAPVHLTAMIGQMYMVQVALGQLSMLGQDPQFEHLSPQINVSLDSFSVLVLALQTELDNFDAVNVEDMRMMDRATFLWSEQDLAQYSMLLDRQVNALNLLLQAVQCKTLQEQQDVLCRQENQEILEMANDCSTSIVGLDDAISLVSENTANISVRFAFDSLILSTQLYQRAERSHLRQAIRAGRADNVIPSLPGNTLKERTSLEAFNFFGESEDKNDSDTIVEVRTITAQGIGEAVSTDIDGQCLTQDDPSPECFDDDSTTKSSLFYHADTLKQLTAKAPRNKDQIAMVDIAVSRLTFPQGSKPVFTTDGRLSGLKKGDMTSPKRSSPESTTTPSTGDVMIPQKPSLKPSITSTKSLPPPPPSPRLWRRNRNLWPSETMTRIRHRIKKSESLISFPLKVNDALKSGSEKRELNKTDRKVLLLGTSESGKSTLVKAMEQELNGSPTTDAERAMYREIIWSNVFHNTRTMLEAMEELGNSLGDEQLQNHAITILISSWSWSSTHEPPPGEDIFTALKALWSDHRFQVAYRQHKDCQLYDCCQYYCENICRIAATDFNPTDVDILHSRVKTTGVAETAFDIAPRPESASGGRMRVLDVGGSLSERKKWVHYFRDVDAVIFVVDVTAYRKVLHEENRLNRMEDQLTIFEPLVNSGWFSSDEDDEEKKETEFILLLTKVDEVELKETTVSLFPPEKYFRDLEDFEGEGDYDWKYHRVHSVERYLQYIEKRFLDLDHRGKKGKDGKTKRRKDVRVLRTNLVDPDENPTSEILDIVMRGKGSDTP